ncbi:MAG: ORF6N domain-containing protein [Tannerella sp.]|nr:ORF6N domain-containing protein [Tannerella sp.]
MSNTVKFKQIEEKILTLRNQNVILDSDVALLYEVETREINQAVRNNPQKFPEGYVVDVSVEDYELLKSKKLILKEHGRGKHVKYLPKAFTEKGLYMLATILKGEKATQTTIDIIEAFAKIRELSRIVAGLADQPDEPKQKALMQRGGEIIAEILDDGLHVSDTESTVEINFALMKFKHTVKRSRK